MSFKKRIVLSSMSAISVIMLFLGNTFKYVIGMAIPIVADEE